MIEQTPKKILVVGAGEAGQMVVSEVRNAPELGARVVGYLDDDPELGGRKISSIPVLGTTGDLEDIVRSEGIEEIIIAVPTAPGIFVRNMMRLCRKAGVAYKIVPGIMEIIKGDVHIDQIRELRVEDLLGRETVSFDIESARRSLEGKTILVTGAGGSIGSELCRQLARTGPGMMVLLGRGENRIFEIEEELRSQFPQLRLETVIGNLVDREKTGRVIGKYRPHVVYHAAAHKHVHYMERDPEEAIINNVLGSSNLIGACEAQGVQRFVFISSDKAADPTGVMGATKRITELFIQNVSKKSNCRLITVRFGNVIGSAGSVVPLFLRQITRGGPVTVSDRDATRYFMTVKEAAFLVIRASLIGSGGETYILDMGEALNIYDMAMDIIMLTGHEPDSEIPLEITGLRDGEKLHETLVGSDERLVPSGEKKIFLAESSVVFPPGIDKDISAMIAAAEAGRREELLGLMSQLLPGFKIN